MSERDLLDLMLDDTRRHKQNDEIQEVVKEALDKIDAPGDRPKIDREPRDLEIETKRRRYAADPDAQGTSASAELCGLRVGSSFDILSGGEQLEGEWVVVKLALSFGSPDDRHLFAGRRGASGPPYIKVCETDLKADIDDGVIRLR